MKQKPLFIKWILTLTPAFLGLIMFFVLPHFKKVSEYVFARGIFRLIIIPLEAVMSIFPFSVTEIAVLSGIPILIILLIVFIVRLFKSTNKKNTAEKGVRFVAFCLSLALFVFMLADGANFNRIPIATLLKLPDKEYTVNDLYTLTCDLAISASNARELLNEDENGCAMLSVSQKELLLYADNSYDNLKEKYPFLKTGVFRVKPVKLSHYWSYTGTTGVYCPWLMEASVNVDVPDFEIAQTASHEIAHTMGFAKENECNFLSWLACSTCDSADYRYSGYFEAFIYSSNALHKADKELWKKAYANCTDGMLRDLKQNRDYWKSFEGEVMDNSQNINNSFIKANGVESGVLSYDEMVELLLRYYDMENKL